MGKQSILQELEIYNGFDLLRALKPHYYIGDKRSWWWPSLLSLEVKNGVETIGSQYSQEPNLSFCFASILGQNTKYEYASFALHNLYFFLYRQMFDMIKSHREKILSCLVETNIATHDDIVHTLQQNNLEHLNYTCLSIMALPIFHDKILEFIASMPESSLSLLIQKAGFYNQKAKRIILLSKNLLHDFGNFATFAMQVDKEWLLKQKGIGNESASSILNYGLKREEMVVDKYTHKLLTSLGFECYEYEVMQDFLCSNLDKSYILYDYDISLAQIMARLHGKIVEYGKSNSL